MSTKKGKKRSLPREYVLINEQGIFVDPERAGVPMWLPVKQGEPIGRNDPIEWNNVWIFRTVDGEEYAQMLHINGKFRSPTIKMQLEYNGEIDPSEAEEVTLENGIPRYSTEYQNHFRKTAHSKKKRKKE